MCLLGDSKSSQIDSEDSFIKDASKHKEKKHVGSLLKSLRDYNASRCPLEQRISLVLPVKNQALKGQTTSSAEAWRKDRVCLSGSVLYSGCLVQTNASSSLLQPGLVGGSKAPLRLDQTEGGQEGKKKEEGRV